MTKEQTRESEEWHSRCHVEVWLMACHLRTELLEPILTFLIDTTLQNTKWVSISDIYKCWRMLEYTSKIPSNPKNVYDSGNHSVGRI